MIFFHYIFKIEEEKKTFYRYQQKHTGFYNTKIYMSILNNICLLSHIPYTVLGTVNMWRNKLGEGKAFQMICDNATL